MTRGAWIPAPAKSLPGQALTRRNDEGGINRRETAHAITPDGAMNLRHHDAPSRCAINHEKSDSYAEFSYKMLP